MRNQLEFGKQILKAAWEMSFSEDVSRLIDRGNGDKANKIAGDMLSNKMTVNFDMFGPFMKDIVVRNLNSTPVIATNSGGKLLRDSHV